MAAAVSTATILGADVGEDFTSYRIQCVCDADKSEWVVLKRYSDFDKLRKALKASGVDIDASFPKKCAAHPLCC